MCLAAYLLNFIESTWGVWIYHGGTEMFVIWALDPSFFQLKEPGIFSMYGSFNAQYTYSGVCGLAPRTW